MEVRRVLSITLFLLLLLPSFVASLLQTSDASVPVCCRAKGKHHCMMVTKMDSSRDTAADAIRERCPAFPKATAWASSQVGTARPSHSEFAIIVTTPGAILQAEVSYRIAWSRSRQKRGPPRRTVQA